MSGSVVFRPQAIRDIDRFAEGYANESIAVAERFYAAIHDATELLADHPMAGRVLEPEVVGYPGLRFWILKGFGSVLLLYMPTDFGVRIIRVFNAAQNYGAELARDATDR